MKKTIALLCILSLMLTAVPFAHATIRDEQKKLEEVNENIDQTKEEIDETKAQAGKIQDSIENVLAKERQLEAKIKKNKEDIALKEAELIEIQKQLQAAIAEVNAQQEQFAVRLRAMYLNNDDESSLALLLSSENVEDFLTKMTYMQAIVDEDKRVLEELNLKQKKVEELQIIAQESLNKLNALKEELAKDQLQLEAIKKELKAREKELKAKLQKLQDDYAKLKATSSDIRNSIAKLQEAARKVVVSKYGPSASTKITPSKGWSWPVPSSTNITSPFGNRIHPVLGYQMFHQGIDISAPSGSSIVAAKNGVVLHSGWWGSYGNCIVLDHGDGYVTIYAHASALYVSVGATVSKGDSIAAVGSTGRSTGPHLHFEISLNSGLVDPLSIY